MIPKPSFEFIMKFFNNKFSRGSVYNSTVTKATSNFWLQNIKFFRHYSFLTGGLN